MADKIDAIIRLRRGLDGERRNIILESGEITFSTDIKRVFIGDGTTLGGVNVGNQNSFGASPNSAALQNDLFFNTTTNVMYLLTASSGGDNISKYRRVTPTVDNTSIVSTNNVLSINPTYLNTYLPLNGGIMTGYITLHAVPTNTFHAATKGYTDTLVRTTSGLLKTGVDGRLPIAGGTMTGYITLHHTPLLEFHPATKGYTDTLVRSTSSALGTTVGTYLPLAGGTLTNHLTLHADPTEFKHAATKQYTDTLVRTTSGNLNNSVGSKYLPLSGGTLTNTLTLNGDPTNNLHAATKQYTDTKINGLSSTVSTKFLPVTGGIITQNLKVNGTLEAVGASTFNGVDFNNKSISKFVVNVKNNINLVPGSDTYTVLPADNGSVLFISATTPCYVAIPKGLPKGFSLLVVKNSTFTLTFKSATVTSPVELLNAYNYISIGNKYGVCNIIILDTSATGGGGTDKALISGDLS